MRLTSLVGTFLLACLAAPAVAQETDATTRASLIERARDEKAAALRPYKPGAAEKWLDYAQSYLTNGQLHWHPFFNSAYAGGGFTVGGGYLQHVGSYNILDFRGSITPSGYKRVEAQFLAPGALAGRRFTVSLLGGWREATQVGFYGTGTSTSKDSRVNYGFKQPYGSASLELFPARRLLVLRGGFEASQWEQTPGAGSVPSIETVYTPATLTGLGAKITYLHSQATVGIDGRPSPGYARRGGFYGVTFHDFTEPDHVFGFKQVDYEAIQHIPLLREAWVLSFRGLVQTTTAKSNEQVPFFMLPSAGGGSDLRGFSSWRFRDRNSLLLQGEWRIMVNRFVDTAVFFDAGKVTAHRSDLNLDDLKTDAGFGFRFHGPLATPLRVDFAKGNEGLAIVFGASAVF
jgi:Omp85 superfamily domain